MTPRSAPSTLPLTLAELLRVDPLSRTEVVNQGHANRSVRRVDLIESFERLRRLAPHSLAVLHSDAATGGWSLAAALHVAWERNAAAVVVPRAAMSRSSAVLAERLGMTLLVGDDDPVDTALAIAGQVSVPQSARALRVARCAELLAEEASIRGVLGVLNSELAGVPVALATGTTLMAGRAAALAGLADSQVRMAVAGPGGRVWADLVASVAADADGEVALVESLLRLARQPLLAAWTQSRLHPSMVMAEEQASFRWLRHVAAAPTEASVAVPAQAIDAVDNAAWHSELGWRVDGTNRAVWLLPGSPLAGEPSAELTQLVRATWARHLPDWPIVRDEDGWVSWSNSPGDRSAAVRRNLAGIVDPVARLGLVIGVGAAHSGINGLVRSAAEAQLAAHVVRGEATVVGGSIQWFEQTGVRAALAWLPLDRIADVAELCLPKLMAARDRSALIETALAVLDAGGSLSQAAQRLGVHRNTVLARVARARELGLIPGDPAQRLALHVLCHALVCRKNQTR